MSEGSKKAPMMKMLIVGLLALVILGGGGFFAFKKFFSKPAATEQAKAEAKDGKEEKDAKDAKGAKAEGEDEDEEESAAGGGHGEGGAAGPAILVYRNNVNLEGKRNAYLVVELHVVFRDAELGKQATSDKPTFENSAIRATILESISGKTVEEVSDTETREAVRKELKEKLNEKFAPKHKAGEKEDPKHKKPKHPIKDVLVVSWAVAQ